MDQSQQIRTVIGLMSGTAMDGVDAALMRTDGENAVQISSSVSIDYDDNFRNQLKSLMGRAARLKGRLDGPGKVVESWLTDCHADAVRALLKKAHIDAQEIDLIGFHGQTIHHAPHEGTSWQIGDAGRLAGKTGIDVVYDFRAADVAAGGEGAPLVPVYHHALAHGLGLALPLVFLNIGGVANLSYIPAGGPEQMLAFDSGPGNGLIDDWVRAQTGASLDLDGLMASRGKSSMAAIERLLDDPYFARQPPKSLDRQHFDLSDLLGFSPEDGAATLTAFTVLTIKLALRLLPEAPKAVYLTGGGRLNKTMVLGLRRSLGMPVQPVDKLGLNGDSLEAEAFGYLAVRSVRGLALSFPGTTGVKTPVSGGVAVRTADHRTLLAAPGPPGD